VSAGFSLLSEPRCRLGGIEDLRGITGGMGGEVGSACEEFDDNEGGTIYWVNAYDDSSAS